MNKTVLLRAKICVFTMLLAPMLGLSGCAWWNDMRGKYDDGTPNKPEPNAVGNLPKVTGGMVLPVNSELVTINEVIAPLSEDIKPIAENGDYLDFRRKAKPMMEQAVTNRVSNIVLYQKARKEAREGIDEQLDKAADNEVKQFVAGFNGNYADAEKVIKRMGMNWKTFLDYQKRLLMVQAYLSEEFKDKTPITYTDLVNYYNKVKAEQFFTPTTIQFRVIDIMPSKMLPDDANQTRQQKAKQIAEILMGKLRAGQDFAVLAKDYSNDISRGPLGGLWTPVAVGSLASPYDVLETEAMKIQPGQVTGPIETKDHVFILKLESRSEQSYKPFEQVQHEVETAMKFNRRKVAVDKLTATLIAQADVGDKEAFTELCLQKAYQIATESN